MTGSYFSAEQLARLRAVCAEDSRVLAVFLFGSHIEGYATAHSDVDLAVLFEADVSLKEEIGLALRFEEALHCRQVDLLNLGKVPLPLRHRVLLTGALLYEREPERVSDFIEATLIRYFDFKPLLDEYYREYDRSLEEAYDLQCAQGPRPDPDYREQPGPPGAATPFDL